MPDLTSRAGEERGSDRVAVNGVSSVDPLTWLTSAPIVQLVRLAKTLHCAVAPPFLLGTCWRCVSDSEVRAVTTALKLWS